ncbi:hypothetical protein MMC30_002611 [Trapelia coarctata]|nr:hypothetical protein [Trapelia coarctata]
MAPVQTSVQDSSEFSGKKLVVFTAVFIPVQISCVALRYLARYLIKGPWGLDDIVVFTSLILQLCMAAIAIGAVKNAGVGYHVPYLLETTPETVTIWAKYLIAIEFIYFGGVNIPKLAILVLYRRLFPKKAIRIVIHVLIAALVGLTISTVVTATVACRPFAANWNPNIPGAVCIDKEAFFIWGSIPNIITDIVMLILPIRVVWNLHTTTRLKFGLTVTFTIGSFGLVTSIVRFATFFQTNSFIDGTWSAVDLIIWTQIEAGVYLISACLMTYRPLLERIGRGRLASRADPSNAANGYTPNHSGDANTGIPLQPRSRIHGMGISRQGFRQLGDRQGDRRGEKPGILVTTNIHVGKDPEGAVGHQSHGNGALFE